MNNSTDCVSILPRRLRIAFVVDRFGNRFGGAEAYGVELMRVLSLQHDITVFARAYDSDCDLRLPYQPIKLWSGWPGWIRSWLFARKSAKATRDGFDIVHSHMKGWCGDVEVVHVTPVRYNWRVRSLPWLKKLSSYVSLRVAMYLHLEARRLRPGKQVVVAVSQLIADQLQQAYGSVHSYPIIAPGVALDTSDQDLPERETIRARYGCSPENVICLLVARNPLRKGLPTILAALAQLPQQYRLMVVGGTRDVVESIRKQLFELKLEERVILIGETSNVMPYYKAVDIYVHPTLNDSFGMAPLEAMSFGLPVILSPVPWCGFAEYVTADHHALVLSHPENAEELTQAIRQLGENQLLAKALVKNSQELLSQFTWRSVAQRYQIIYQSILQQRNC